MVGVWEGVQGCVIDARRMWVSNMNLHSWWRCVGVANEFTCMVEVCGGCK